MNDKQALTHAEASALLQDYLAEELEARERALVEQHLQQCISCQHSIMEIRRIRSLLNDIGKGDYSMTAYSHRDPLSTSSLANTILAKIDTRGSSFNLNGTMVAQNDDPHRTIAMPRSRRRTLSRNLSLLVACAVLVLVVGSFLALIQMIQHSNTAHPQTPTIRPTVLTRPSSPGIYVAMQSYLYKLDKNGKTKLWEHAIKGLGSTIVVTNNVVYADSSSSQNGNDAYAFRATDGKLLWQHRIATHSQHGTNAPATLTGLAADSQNVYVASDEVNIYALNASNGTLRWMYPTHSTSTNGYSSSVTVANDVLYACVSNHFYALNTATGRLSWSHSGNSDETFLAPLIVNGTVYVTSATNPPSGSYSPPAGSVVYGYSTVYAWTVDGKFRWSSQQINDLASDAPISGDNHLYVTGETSVYALNRTNGKIDWQSAVGATASHTPLYDHGTLSLALQGPYRGTPAQNSGKPNISSIIALNGRNGSLVWEKKNMNRPTIQTVVNGVLYAELQDDKGNGHVYALNPTNGTTLWSYTHPIPNPTQPQGAGNTLIVIP